MILKVFCLCVLASKHLSPFFSSHIQPYKPLLLTFIILAHSSCFSTFSSIYSRTNQNFLFSPARLAGMQGWPADSGGGGGGGRPPHVPGGRPARREVALHVVFQQHPRHRGSGGSPRPGGEGTQLPGLHPEASVRSMESVRWGVCIGESVS